MNIRLNRDISKLKFYLQHMLEKVDIALKNTYIALEQNNIDIAKNVIKNDSVIDNIEVKIDKRCNRILALSTPLASDLRFVVSSIKINTELERIGDFASLISELVINLINLNEEFSDKNLLIELIKINHDISIRAMKSFLIKDIKSSYSFIKNIRTYDSKYKEIFELTIESNYKKGLSLNSTLAILNIIKYCERIRDHAINICENTVYTGEGNIIKHSSLY